MIVSICWILVTNFALFNSAQECVDKLDNCGLIAKRNLCEIQTYQRQCCISCGRQDSLPNNLPSNIKWVQICTEIYVLFLTKISWKQLFIEEVVATLYWETRNFYHLKDISWKQGHRQFHDKAFHVVTGHVQSV